MLGDDDDLSKPLKTTLTIFCCIVLNLILVLMFSQCNCNKIYAVIHKLELKNQIGIKKN